MTLGGEGGGVTFRSREALWSTHASQFIKSIKRAVLNPLVPFTVFSRLFPDVHFLPLPGPRLAAGNSLQDVQQSERHGGQNGRS